MAATPVILITGLSTPSLYVDYFIVRLFDSTGTQVNFTNIAVMGNGKTGTDYRTIQSHVGTMFAPTDGSGFPIHGQVLTLQVEVAFDGATIIGAANQNITVPSDGSSIFSSTLRSFPFNIAITPSIAIFAPYLDPSDPFYAAITVPSGNIVVELDASGTIILPTAVESLEIAYTMPGADINDGSTIISAEDGVWTPDDLQSTGNFLMRFIMFFSGSNIGSPFSYYVRANDVFGTTYPWIYIGDFTVPTSQPTAPLNTKPALVGGIYASITAVTPLISS